MAKVFVNKDFGLDFALKEFKRRVNKDNILFEYRKREFFMSRRELKKFKAKNKFKKK